MWLCMSRGGQRVFTLSPSTRLMRIQAATRMKGHAGQRDMAHPDSASICWSTNRSDLRSGLSLALAEIGRAIGANSQNPASRNPTRRNEAAGNLGQQSGPRRAILRATRLTVQQGLRNVQHPWLNPLLQVLSKFLCNRLPGSCCEPPLIEVYAVSAPFLVMHPQPRLSCIYRVHAKLYVTTLRT